MIDPRSQLRYAPHMVALAEHVDELRAKGLAVPDLDPNDGGTEASAIVLLESPGPKAVASGYISRDNPDPSARNMSKLLREAGFNRRQVALWNVVPYCVSTADRNINASVSDIRTALPYTNKFISLFPRLSVILLCGRHAQKVERFLELPDRVALLKTFHPGAQSYNQPSNREHMKDVFAQAAQLINRH